MSEPETITAVTDAVAVASPAEGPAEGDAKARFSKALDEARAGAVALGKDVQGKAGAYADRLGAKGHDLLDDAKALTEEAKDRAATLADEGKVRASEALVSLGKLVEENAALVEEKLGGKYGEYFRTAAQHINDAAARIEAKDLGELGEDARTFVREKPALAVGLAAAGGFVLARLFGGKSSK